MQDKTVILTLYAIYSKTSYSQKPQEGHHESQKAAWKESAKRSPRQLEAPAPQGRESELVQMCSWIPGQDNPRLLLPTSARMELNPVGSW